MKTPEERTYHYNCTNAPNLPELNHIVDNHLDISYRTFRKNVNKVDFERLMVDLGYGRHLHMKNDWHVGFHRSRYQGEYIYFFTWSGIEYVFKQKEEVIKWTKPSAS